MSWTAGSPDGSMAGCWKRWCPTSSPVSLILSLIFGAGQVIAGILVAWYSLRHGIWARLRPFLLFLVSLWFFCSGCLELFVSSLELSRRLGNSLSLDTFNLWRARADSVLVWVSIVLFASLLLYPILHGRRRKQHDL